MNMLERGIESQSPQEIITIQNQERLATCHSFQELGELIDNDDVVPFDEFSGLLPQLQDTEKEQVKKKIVEATKDFIRNPGDQKEILARFGDTLRDKLEELLFGAWSNTTTLVGLYEREWIQTDPEIKTLVEVRMEGLVQNNQFAQ